MSAVPYKTDGFVSYTLARWAAGLTVDQLVNAAGISGSRTGSLGAVTAGKLTNMKNTVDPWATRLGVESALLAKRGYSGPEHIFDGKEGLFHVFGHSSVDGSPCSFDAEAFVDKLPASSGDHYRILDCGMKSFPIEALSHAPLTAMMKRIAEHSIKPEQVAEIRVEVFARAADILGDPHKYRPEGKETADHSLPYCLAVGLTDGTEVATRVDVPKGDPRDPMTPDKIAVKFNALGSSIVGEAQCNQIGDLVMRLDTLDTIDDLMRLMTAGG